MQFYPLLSLSLYLTFIHPLGAANYPEVYVANYLEIKLKLRNVTIRGNSISRYRDRTQVESALRRRVELSVEEENGKEEKRRKKMRYIRMKKLISREALSNPCAGVISTMCPLYGMLIILTWICTRTHHHAPLDCLIV